MITSHPYNLWPLHVKLFTAEAEKFWGMLAKAPAYRALPRGLTVSVELEGVDGQSGSRGSGRTGPVDVADSKEFLMRSFGISLTPITPSSIHFAISGEEYGGRCLHDEARLLRMWRNNQ